MAFCYLEARGEQGDQKKKKLNCDKKYCSDYSNLRMFSHFIYKIVNSCFFFFIFHFFFIIYYLRCCFYFILFFFHLSFLHWFFFISWFGYFFTAIFWHFNFVLFDPFRPISIRLIFYLKQWEKKTKKNIIFFFFV